MSQAESKDWLKFKNPEAPAERREAEEDRSKGFRAAPSSGDEWAILQRTRPSISFAVRPAAVGSTAAILLKCSSTKAATASGTGPATMTGAQFEIRIDEAPRTYRDRKDFAMDAASFLKSRNPHSVVEVRDLPSGEVTAVTYKAG
jgi:hypothetical protein